ncbi:mechanosensitive ion channel domain-containing protein [Pleionea sp. CnH1-48]|uniref:mechanosensitive ion channel family protein n=1 Tax=Pleionea sp. CnH1-48 TaxID=2954494 RepID=UPI00209719AD|nr:mechanosensitive ion channel family protein [Pleionea sp. CnH1-48]
MEVITKWLYDIQGESAWMTEIFILVLLTLILSFSWSIFSRKVSEKFDRTKNFWDDALILAMIRPVNWAIWVIGVSYAIELSQSNYLQEIITFSLAGEDAQVEIRDVILIGLFGWFLNRFIRQVEKNMVVDQKGRERDDRIDETTIYAISKLLRVSVTITVTLVILQTVGISISAVLAFGGIGGIAVGFAAKDLLANFFGGLIIYLDRPFAVGDWVRSPDRNIEGTVEYIGWRQTRIRTFDKRPLYVPNAVFNSVALENPSRMSHRRIYETIGIRYQDIGQMSDIVQAVKAMLSEHPEIAIDQTMIVNFNSFAPSSVDFFVYTFTKTTNWIRFHEIKQDVLLKIADIITQHGAEMAFPTSTVHLQMEPEQLAQLGSES